MVRCTKCGFKQKGDHEGKKCECGGLFTSGKVGAGKKCTMVHKLKNHIDRKSKHKKKWENYEQY